MCLHVLFSFYILSFCYYSDSTLPALSLFHPNLWSVRNWDICQRKHCHKEKMLLAAEGLCICPAKFPFKWIFKANHCGFSIATPWDSLNESPPAENIQKSPGNNIAWRSQRCVRVVLSIVSGSDNLDKFWLQFFLENHKNVWKTTGKCDSWHLRSNTGQLSDKSPFIAQRVAVSIHLTDQG